MASASAMAENTQNTAGQPERAITGTDGRNMSMPSAVSATRTPSRSVDGLEPCGTEA